MANKKTAFVINMGCNGYRPGEVSGIPWGKLKAKLENEGITDDDIVILKNERDTASYYGIDSCDPVESVDFDPEED